eukprot:7511282-Prorocentrum_lima.AAC.1
MRLWPLTPWQVHSRPIPPRPIGSPVIGSHNRRIPRRLTRIPRAVSCRRRMLHQRWSSPNTPWQHTLV